MAAMALHSVTLVFRKETAFALLRTMDRHIITIDETSREWTLLKRLSRSEAKGQGHSRVTKNCTSWDVSSLSGGSSVKLPQVSGSCWKGFKVKGLG